MAFNIDAFKKDHKKYGEEDLKSQLVHLRELAKVYKHRATQTDRQADNRWLVYVQAHGLINSCLTRCSADEVPILEEQLFSLERHWYGEGHSPFETIQNWRDCRQEHKKHLQNIRADCKLRFQQCGTEVTFMNTNNLFSDVNLQIASTFANAVQKESKYCTQRMIEFAKKLCQSSEAIMTSKYGKPPCSYAVIALGSMAREEATPYSDLEYAFIIEDNCHRQYFHNLAVDTYFRLANLGETPLKYFYIPELVGWFVDRSQTGFRIDGLMPKAGNIPTGNGLKSDSLILTVEDLVERFKSCLDETNQPGIVGDFASLLSSIEPVYCYPNGEELVNEFLCQTVGTGCNAERVQCSIHTLVEDVEKHSADFCPENLQVDMRSLEIKTHIFRYPTILALDLKIAMSLDGQSAWDIFHELYSQGFIVEETLASLLFVLTAAIWIRTSAYLQTDTQKEVIAFHPMYDAQTADDRFYAPKSLYIAMACRLVPIKQKMLKIVEGGTVESFRIENIISALQSLRCENVDFFLQARLHYTCGDCKGGLHHIQVSLQDEHVTDDVFRFMDRVQENLSNAMLLTAYLLFHDGQFDTAISYFQQLCNIEKLEKNDCITLASFQATIGQCLMNLGKHEDARKKFDEAASHIKDLFGIGSVREMRKPPTAKHKLDTDLMLFANVDVRFLAYSVAYHQGRYKKARTSFNNLIWSYQLLKHLIIGKSEQNLVVADFNMSFGLYHIEFAEYKKAEECFMIAYNIYKYVFGVSSATIDLSSMHLHLGTLALKRANYIEAKKHGKCSLDMLQRSGQSTPCHLIACYEMLAELYFQIGEYSMSLENVRLCLAKISECQAEAFLLSTAMCLMIHAKIIWMRTVHQNKETNESMLEAKTMVVNAINLVQKTVHEKARESHPHVLKARRILALICLHLTEMEEAQKTAKQALTGSLVARGVENTTHPDILGSKLVVGKIHLHLGDLDTSQYLFNDVQKGYKELHGVSGVHPHIAEAYHGLSQVEVMCGNNLQAWKHAAESVLTLERVFGKESRHPLLVTYQRSLGANLGLVLPGIVQKSF